VRYSPVLVAVVSCVAFIVAAASADEQQGGSSPVGPKTSPAPETVDHGAEIRSLRTRFSRTYEGDSGSGVLVASPEPMNYRDDAGAWRAIDNDLISTASGYENSANDWQGIVPINLSHAAELHSGGDQLRFVMQGATSDVLVNGATATYAQALPDTDVAYEMRGAGLKETLSLTSVSSPASYRWTMNIGVGGSASLQDDGTVSVEGARGTTFVVSRPVIADASGHEGVAHYTLDEVGDGEYHLTLHLDRVWLDDSARSFPVTVDPSVSVGKDVACWLDGTAASDSTSGHCDGTPLQLASASGHESKRAMAHFPLTLPDDADVSYASLTLTESTGLSQAYTGGVYALLRGFNSNATWQKTGIVMPDGSRPDWTGAFAEGPDDHQVDFTAPAHCNAFDANGVCTQWTPVSFDTDITDMVQGWINGRYNGGNFGLALRATRTNGALSGAITLTANPTLTIVYQTATGERPQFPYDHFGLTDRSGVSVNLATGNLEYKIRDFQMAGPQHDLVEDRLYDSRRLGLSTDLGAGWKFSLGRDTKCSGRCDAPGYDQTTVVDAPDGAVFGINPGRTAPTFYGSTGVRAPDGENAVLGTAPSAHGEGLIDNGSGEILAIRGPVWSQSISRSGRKYTFHAPQTPKASGCTTGTTGTIQGDEALPPPPATGGTLTYLTFTTDCANHIIKMVDLLGRTWQYGYDTAGRLHTYTDPLGGVTTYDYDPQSPNKLTKITSPGGRWISITYSDNSSTSTDPNKWGRVQSITQKIDNSTTATTTYSFSGSVGSPCQPGERHTTVTDPENKRRIVCYDDRGRLMREIDSAGRDRDANTYGALSKIASFKTGGSGDPAAPFATDVATQTGNTNATTSPTGATTSATYGMGANPYQPDKTFDEQGNETDYTYSLDNDISGITPYRLPAAPEGLRLTWSTTGLLQSIQLGVSAPHTTQYKYDQGDRLVEIDPPVAATNPLGATKFGYDAANRVTSHTDGRGTRTTNTWDNLDRLRSQSTPDGSHVDSIFDPDGLLTERDVFGPGGSLQAKYKFAVDGLGDVTSATIEDGSGTTLSQYTRAYTYYKNGDLKTITTPAGTTTYTYNADDLPATVADPATGTTYPIRFTYDSDSDAGTVPHPHGRLVKVEYPDLTPGASAPYATGVVTRYTYDDSDRIKTITSTGNGGSTLQSWDYRYLVGNSYGGDSHDHALRQLVVRPDGTCERYLYDYLNRLTQANTYASTDCDATSTTPTPLSRRLYSYDGDSNLTVQEQDDYVSGSWVQRMKDTFAFDVADQLTSVNSTTATHDGAGNLTARPADSRDGGLSASYSQLGQMQSLTFTPLGESATNQILGYSSGDNDELETVGTTHWLNSSLGPIASVPASGGATYYTRDPSGAVLDSYQGAGSSPHYFLRDARGSTIRTTSGAGSPDQSPLSYDPYGNLPIGANAPPIGFDGGLVVGTSTVQHFGERYYDPSSGRWTQADPMDQTDSTVGYNKYAYADDDPVNNSDRDGSKAMNVGDGPGCTQQYVGCAYGPPPSGCNGCGVHLNKFGKGCLKAVGFGSAVATLTSFANTPSVEKFKRVLRKSVTESRKGTALSLVLTCLGGGTGIG
jgi:RHS repeat-associated protein